MSENISKLFFSLIKSELVNEKIEYTQLTDEEIKELFILSKKHDVVNLIADALIRNNLIETSSPYYAKFRYELKYSVGFVANLEYEIEHIKLVFKKNHISYILLKGSVLRNYYPEPWMRTSCDIDVLVRDEQLDEAVNALTQTGYKVEGNKHYHDINLYAPGGMHLELHHNIKEREEKMDRVLDKVWQYSVKVNDFEYAEIPEFFRFHHIAHMAYHFIHGGCGIRSFIDLWIFENKIETDDKIYRDLLKQANLEKFEKYAFKLMHYWLDNGGADEQILNMEHYILTGSTYGSTEKSVIIGNYKAGSKFKYFLNRIFMPLEDLATIYPKLYKHKWLLPFYQISRWTKIFKKRKSVKQEINLTVNSKEDYSIDMMKNLDLIN